MMHFSLRSLAFQCIIFALIHTYAFSSTEKIRLPIEERNTDGSVRNTFFEFGVDDEDLHQTTTRFCEESNILFHLCRKLYLIASKNQQEARNTRRDRLIVDKAFPSTIDGNYDSLDPLYDSSKAKYFGALQAEMRSVFRSAESVDLMEKVQSHLLHALQEKSRSISEGEEIVRVAFIHSVSFDRHNTREIEIMLQSLMTHGLSDELQMIAVLSYGEYQIDLLSEAFPDVLFVHVSSDTSFHEIPTLNVMREMSKFFQELTAEPVHVLYMKAMTSEYQSTHLELEDWRSLLLHLMVKQHRVCYHLIESREVDVVVAEYLSNQRAVKGNYWWASSHYLAKLPLIPLDTPHSSSVVSTWLFTHWFMRVHLMHNSKKNHHVDRYPRFCYAAMASVTDAPTFDDFVAKCNNKSLLEYSMLHNRSALSSPPETQQVHKASASCSTMQLFFDQHVEQQRKE